MYCSSCGASNPEGSDVCGSCGARLTTNLASFEGEAAPEVPPQLHAMRVGDILDEMIRLFRQNFRTFIAIVAVLQVPLAILQMMRFVLVTPSMASFYGFTDSGESELGPIAFYLLSSLVLTVAGLLAFVITQAALASAISQRYLGRETSFGKAYRMMLASLWRLLLTFLLVGIVLFLLSITLIGIPIAIYLFIRLSLVVQVVVLEGKGVSQALARSSWLVRGSWWRVFGVMLVSYFIQYLVRTVPGIIVGAVIAAVGAYISPGTVMITTAVGMLAGSLFGILSAPLMPTISTLLYYDLRIRKEGFDLQLMADRLGNSPLPAIEGRL